MMKRILIVGGANGIGLAIATEMAKKTDCEKIYIVDKAKVEQEYIHPKFESYQFDLLSDDYSFFERFSDIDSLMITAGFGKLSLFKDISPIEGGLGIFVKINKENFIGKDALVLMAKSLEK